MKIKSNSEKCWSKNGVFGDSSCEKLDEIVHCFNCEIYSIAGRELLNKEIPEGMIEEWTEILSKPKEVKEVGNISVFIFRIGSEWLAIKTIFVYLVTTPQPGHSIPNKTNKIFKGVVNINGELHLYFSINEVLNSNEEIKQSHKKSSHSRMLVFSRSTDKYVLHVDEILGMQSINPDDINSAPSTLSNSPTSFISGVFNFKTKKIGMLDEEKFYHLLDRSLKS